MKLTFLGTRGQIEPRNRRHNMHTALLVEYRGARIMIDCGEDWLDQIPKPAPHAILLTHAHPDHAFGLQEGAPCPVYATEVAWSSVDHYPIEDRRTIEPRTLFEIRGVRFEAFAVEHSLRCPAVAYRVTAGRAAIFYAPDVVYIPERDAALAGVDRYIGDGASLDESLVRRKGDRIFGHAAMRTQLTWCRKSGVDHAIFTHCGAHIVGGDESAVLTKLREYAAERGVEATIACDAMELVLR